MSSQPASAELGNPYPGTDDPLMFTNLKASSAATSKLTSYLSDFESDVLLRLSGCPALVNLRWCEQV